MNDTAGSAGRRLAAVRRAPARPQPPPARKAKLQPLQAPGSLRDALPRPGRGRARRAAGRRDRHAGGADRGAPHDRLRLRRRAHRADRSVFRRDDLPWSRCSRCASASRYYLVTTLGERVVADMRAAVFGHLDRAVGAVLRHRADRRTDLAAHRRHHADQVRGRLLGLGRAAQPRAVLRLRHHDGGHEPEALGLRARRHSADRAAAGRLRPRGAPALARGAGHARRRLGLCRRADRRGAHAAGLHQRAAGARRASPSAVERAYRAAIALDQGARHPDRDHHLPRLRERRGRSLGRRAGRASPARSRRAGSASSCCSRCLPQAGSASSAKSGASCRRPRAPPSG